jgi:hypothetical protein
MTTISAICPETKRELSFFLLRKHTRTRMMMRMRMTMMIRMTMMGTTVKTAIPAGVSSNCAAAAGVGEVLGLVEGEVVGEVVVGEVLGLVEGEALGDVDGDDVGEVLGLAEGEVVGEVLGLVEGEVVGEVLGLVEGETVPAITVHPLIPASLMASADVSALNVTTSSAPWTLIAALHTNVRACAAAHTEPTVMVSVSTPLPTCEDVAEVMVPPPLSVHVTVLAALQMPCDAANVTVPPLGSSLVGVTTKVTPVGVVAFTLRPSG